MRLFVDTNVLIASATDEPARGETATRLLNLDHDFCTSLINLMELRTVLTKKKRVEQERVEALERRITDGLDLIVPDASDMVRAHRHQREALLYPLDAILLACAENQDAELVSFDAEVVDNGGAHPDEILG